MKKVKITFTYSVDYDSPAHLREVLKSLKETPITGVWGTGYAAKRIGKGREQK